MGIKGVVLSTLVVMQFNVWASDLKSQNIGQEWKGASYADYTLTEFYRRNYGFELMFDLKDLDLTQSVPLRERMSHAQNEVRLARSSQVGFMRELSVFAKGSMPQGFKDLIYLIEAGMPIPSQIATAQAQSDLHEWVLSQQDGSILPHDLILKSLEITRGHVVAAWILAWNYTSEGWFNSPTRNYALHRIKFKSLTGESHLWQGSINYIYLESSEHKVIPVYIQTPEGKLIKSNGVRKFKPLVTKRGDEFSYLYHRFGVELLTMIVAENIGGLGFIGEALGKSAAIAESLSYKNTAGLPVEKIKRVNNDLLAAESGARFYKLIKNKKNPNIQLNKSTFYLQTNKRFLKKDYVLPSDRSAFYFGSKVDAQYFSEMMSLEELKNRFYYATHVDSEIFNSVLLATNGEYERLYRGLVAYEKSPFVDEALNQYLRKYRLGFRALPEEGQIDIVDNEIRAIDGNVKFAQTLAPDFEFSKIEENLYKMIDRALVKDEKIKKERAELSLQKIKSLLENQKSKRSNHQVLERDQAVSIQGLTCRSLF